jgi:hypothetical protein
LEDLRSVCRHQRLDEGTPELTLPLLGLGGNVPTPFSTDESAGAQDGANGPPMHLMPLPGTHGRHQLGKREPTGLIDQNGLDRGTIRLTQAPAELGQGFEIDQARLLPLDLGVGPLGL